MTADNQSSELVRHVVRIKHDAESHKYDDCHDDCTTELICAGVTDACRVWDACGICTTLIDTLSKDEFAAWVEQMYEEGEAHGEEHMHYDGLWMTPTDRCMTQACEEHDAAYLVSDLPEGDHPVNLEWDEGYVQVTPVPDSTKGADRG